MFPGYGYTPSTASPTWAQGALHDGLLLDDPAFRAVQYQDLEGAVILYPTSDLPVARSVVGSEKRDIAHALRRACVPQHECSWCGKRFTRKLNRNEHILRHENQLTFSCNVAGCTQRVNTRSDLRGHRRRCHDRGAAEAQAE
ncbi:uncharacterized protein SCHCODRAFT_02697590 [Schizophyllum commune H4-8]|uniref:uncharacterized protein n=1 Tax=Schizophyllum commune (strain H4-8 / FGSC 9210) TaxID=578458 RepID=UPI00215F7A22|nr:uncharacterized protein SCHCODRAFT_02697590 [Schizophyllum commune H4-8]KAI5896106.1 hypothetical protein SCHCODRAFT_02697590 [Schizophyllum commune H4-8]